MLDMAVRAQDQIERRLPRGKRLHMLGRERMQPGEPIWPGDRDNTTVRQVDPALTAKKPALFPVGIAVVPGHSGVG